MSNYLDRPQDILQDTKQFVDSGYGQHIIGIIEEKAAGMLARADDVECPYPERYLAKHSMAKEILDLINQPLLDDDTLTRG